MKKFKGNCSATGIGSLPHAKATDACKLIKENFDEIPYWPQLPQYGGKYYFKENMYVQFSKGLSGFTVDEKKGKYWVDSTKIDENDELVKYIESAPPFKVPLRKLPPEYAHGLYGTLKGDYKGIRAIKGQVTSPLTMGYNIKDENDEPIIRLEKDIPTGPYGIIKEVTMTALLHWQLDAVVKWQVEELSKICKPVIIFFDEPTIGMVSSKKAIKILSGAIMDLSIMMKEYNLDVLIGVHSCQAFGNWGDLLQACHWELDLISFDAFQHTPISLHDTKRITSLLSLPRGIISWGIVPVHHPDVTMSVNSDQLVKKMEGYFSKLVKQSKGSLTKQDIAEHSLITPSCGMGGFKGAVKEAEYAIKLTKEVSDKLQENYSLRD